MHEFGSEFARSKTKVRKGGEDSGGEEGPGKEMVEGYERRQAGERTVAAEDIEAEIGGREVVRSRPRSGYVSSHSMTGGRNVGNLSSSVEGNRGEGEGHRQWRSPRESRQGPARYR